MQTFFSYIGVIFSKISKIMNISNKLLVWLICFQVTLHVTQSATLFNRDSAPKLFHNISQYNQERNSFLSSELESSVGSDIVLNEKEIEANKIIMKAKEDELNIGFLKPHLFNPARHIFEILDVVKQSKLFQIIQKMPKGGILHAHDTAICPPDFMVSLTYWPNLWQLTSSNSIEIEKFIFSRERPKNGIWRRVADVRAEMGASKYDKHVRKIFTLFDKDVDPRSQFKDGNDVWNRFEIMFMKINPILSFAPVRKAYYKQALTEVLNDGVQYYEFRAGISKVFIPNFF